MKNLRFKKQLIYFFCFLPFLSTGQTLNHVKIGTQVWMAENLNVNKFRNGDIIPEAKTNEEWQKAIENQQPAWCFYDNSIANGVKFGKLYNWFAVNDPRGLAPFGWHIPTSDEWSVLINYLGGYKVAGTKLKSTSGYISYSTGGADFKDCPNCKDWNNEYRSKVACHNCRDTRRIKIMTPVVVYSGNGNNTIGFSGLAGGAMLGQKYGNYNENWFSGLGEKSYWWEYGKSFGQKNSAPNTSLRTYPDEHLVYCYQLNYRTSAIYYNRTFHSSSYGNSDTYVGLYVRCVSDVGVSDMSESNKKISTTTKSGTYGKTKVVVQQYTKYDPITPEDREKGFGWMDCENKDFPFEYGCKNNKIGHMNECLFGNRLSGIFSSDLWESIIKLGLAKGNDKKQITKEIYEKIVSNCKKK
jgi:uncharacterized protein (TIGR02145 family)